MRVIGCLSLIVFLCFFSPGSAYSQTWCTEGEFLGSCVYCDGVLITGAAYYTSLGQCNSCFVECPEDLLPEGGSQGQSGSTERISCGLTWDEFAERARSADKAGAEAEIRYIEFDAEDELLESLARRAPLIANFLLMQDGHIRLDFSDESLSSVTEEPAMMSGFDATTEMANWLIANRQAILTEAGRNELDPPLGRKLDANERQAVYTNVDRIGSNALMATVRATRFRMPAGNGDKPEVLRQQVLELELEAGRAQKIPDHIRPVLGDPRPGRRLRVEIVDSMLHTDQSSSLAD